MKILFQGDSVTDALRTTLGGASLGTGYPLFAAAELLASYPNAGFEFINRGISGNRCVDLYQRWKVDGLNLEPDLISILIGINDTWHEDAFKNGVEVPRAEKVLRELLSWTKEVLPDVKLVICEPFMLTESQAGEGFKCGENWSAPDSWIDEVSERRAMTLGIAKDFGAVCVPFQTVFDEALKIAPASHWLADGVHPTAAGHMLMAKAWIKAAGPLLGI